MSMAAPDDVIDFTHWKLQYGAYSSGGDDSEKTSSQLKNGWSDSDYFYSNAANSWVFFIAPVDGAKTSSNASGSRTELRHQPTQGKDSYFNLSNERRLLRSIFLVEQLPENNDGKLVIGQIHGETSSPPLKLQVRNKNGKLRASVIWNDKPVNGKNTSIDITDSSTDLSYGKTYRYFISTYQRDGKSFVKVTLKDGSTTIGANTQEIGGSILDDDWENEGAYFKAGVYNQNDDSDGSSDFSKVRFRTLLRY